ncbi:MAG: Cof-type HAD-IIB family hydrolase [Muribaculum sp.]|nr:Cof-type HAD-IIB family hydrolase [Muribaculum sp.]
MDKSNSPRALFFDIDGTLVSFKTHKVPDSTVEALKRAKRNGHKIFISTGRPYVIINNLRELQEAGLIDGYITMNGSYCFVGDKVLYKSCIPAEEVRIMADIADKSGYPSIFVSEHSMKVCRPDEEVRKIFYDFLQIKKLPETKFSDAVNDDIYQMTIFFNEDVEQEIASMLPSCEFNRWYPTFVDLTAKGNTKAKGIKILADYCGIPMSDTVAFGDGGNDVPMIEEAGLGIAMGNASDEVKSHADYVTDTVDNDGIAKALKHVGLI